MLHVLERDYLQHCDAVEEEFPNCRLLMCMESNKSDYGYLQIVCDSIDSIKEFREYIRNNHYCLNNTYIFGFFKEEHENYDPFNYGEDEELDCDNVTTTVTRCTREEELEIDEWLKTWFD